MLGGACVLPSPVRPRIPSQLRFPPRVAALLCGATLALATVLAPQARTQATHYADAVPFLAAGRGLVPGTRLRVIFGLSSLMPGRTARGQREDLAVESGIAEIGGVAAL